MKVLLVSQEFPPETRWGGIGTYAGILAPALVRAGAHVTVLSVVRDQPASDRVIDGVRVLRLSLRPFPGLGRLSGMPESARRVQLARAVDRAVAQFVRADGPFDVAECPDWNAEGLVLAFRRRLPTVVRLHSMASQLFPYLGSVGRDERTAIRLEDRAIRHATLVVGTAAQVAEAARRRLAPPSRLRTLTLPVEPVAADPEFVHATAGRIVFVGRFEQRKAPEVLVDAMPAVRGAIRDARLVLVGRDCARPEHPSAVTWLRERAERLGVGEAVEMVDGWASADAVRDQLLRATVFAVPSRWESFGYVAAEAASIGRPVVASSVAGFADVVTDGVTGRVVAPDDPQGWSRALVEVLSDRDRAQAWGRAGALRMATECDPQRIAHETLALYEEAAWQFASKTPAAAGAGT